jgi:excisionase family DNA binding protein/predicted Zn finger-like uncharacterized protein
MQTICPKCNTRFSVSDKFLGRKARCLKCKALFFVGKAPPSKTTKVEMPGDSERFYSVKDLAEMFNVNPMTIYRMVSRGQLTCYQIGRAKRFRPSDVENFLNQNANHKNK